MLVTKIGRFLFPKLTWRLSKKKPLIYLTFDDGPVPEVTEWVLNILKEEQIKATFFCIGQNIEKYPKIFDKITKEGHAIGNHTYNHLNGWKTKTEIYLNNFEDCEAIINKHYSQNVSKKLFRPPYGKITYKQSKEILKKGYKIVMWDVLSKDYNINTNSEKVLENVINNTKNGSIIVYHDSMKAKEHLYVTLPKAIKALKNKGFRFEKLN